MKNRKHSAIPVLIGQCLLAMSIFLLAACSDSSEEITGLLYDGRTPVAISIKDGLIVSVKRIARLP